MRSDWEGIENVAGAFDEGNDDEGFFSEPNGSEIITHAQDEDPQREGTDVGQEAEVVSHGGGEPDALESRSATDLTADGNPTADPDQTEGSSDGLLDQTDID